MRDCAVSFKKGCTNSKADNYDAAANEDDGSCLTCTIPGADNYDSFCSGRKCVDNGKC
jgi:hypothetical protein